MPDFLPFKGYKEKIFLTEVKKNLSCVYIYMCVCDIFLYLFVNEYLGCVYS